MNFQIGQKVKIKMDRESILNGRVFEVTDVIRSIFHGNEILAVEVKIGDSEHTFYPEECEIV